MVNLQARSKRTSATFPASQPHHRKERPCNCRKRPRMIQGRHWSCLRRPSLIQQLQIPQLLPRFTIQGINNLDRRFTMARVDETCLLGPLSDLQTTIRALPTTLRLPQAHLTNSIRTVPSLRRPQLLRRERLYHRQRQVTRPTTRPYAKPQSTLDGPSLRLASKMYKRRSKSYKQL